MDVGSHSFAQTLVSALRADRTHLRRVLSRVIDHIDWDGLSGSVLSVHFLVNAVHSRILVLLCQT